MGREFVTSQSGTSALPRLAPGRFHIESHFLDDVSANEPANAVILPVGRLGNFRQGCALLAAYQLQDDRRFASGSGVRLTNDYPSALLSKFLSWR